MNTEERSQGMENQAVDSSAAHDLIAAEVARVFAQAARIHECTLKISVDVWDASLLTGIPVPSLNKMRSEGTGPTYTKVGARVYYSPEDLRDFIRKGRKIVS